MVNETKRESIYLGQATMDTASKKVAGKVVEFDGKSYYKIENYDEMTPFFMNIVSDSDNWIFISSTGALSAGRRNPDNALFPYYNDDRIHDSQDITGAKTIILAKCDNRTFLWQPFSKSHSGIYKISRNIYKRPLGNDIIFEEINHDLGLSFLYRWTSSDRLGLIRQARIMNHGNSPKEIRILDGIQNVLPAGVDRGTQLAYSTLLDGYKKNELLLQSGIGVYTLSSLLSDRAEPAESLLSTIVWSAGIKRDATLISSIQLDAFAKGESVETEKDIRARRGAYFVNSNFVLDVNEDKNWYFVADLKIDAQKLSELRKMLEEHDAPEEMIKEEIAKSDKALEKIVARADGRQLGNDEHTSFRHYSVSLFNVMRGGIFENNYTIDKTDLLSFIKNSSTSVFSKNAKALEALPESFYYNEIDILLPNKDADLERLTYEYLPLSFSRRHGDPSRPWNDFSIDIQDDQGNRTLNYQGNWRDVFQNWEALALAFPEFIEGMIAKFVNSTTADGYNPYRLTRDGFDWEAPEPDKPFANIGYWGDHQIVYLLKLLKLSSKYHPGKLEELLNKNIYSYANVPYRIRSYQDTLKDPQDTILFDHELHDAIMKDMKVSGTDAQRLSVKNDIYHVNLTEKLLVPLLTKLSNFIPGAGIWMNTQRPEWNDANNALVGYGVSMVTLYYMRDHVDFLSNLFEGIDQERISVSEEVDKLFSGIFTSLIEYRDYFTGKIDDAARKSILDKLGQCGSEYREQLYTKGFSSNKVFLTKKDILGLLTLAQKFIDKTIAENKREDGLYHAYNVISIKDSGIKIRRLYEMLEGQVALLSSGYLSAQESVEVLDALRQSKLYRKDQRSYILYPDRKLPRFDEKNIIPEALLKRSKLLQKDLVDGNTRFVQKDAEGKIHFNSTFSNGRILKKALLDELERDFESESILEIYEAVFDHQSFTGRSGTFYKYEGLGCIFWHMVSKLLLAVQDSYFRAVDTSADAEVLQALKAHYYEIHEGIGSHKSPEEYGSFPMDPYSHTPGYSGVQQPGMTGQAKEDILARNGELGLRVKNGKIHFEPTLLKDEEFLQETKLFTYYDLENKEETLMLGENMLAFTLCQVPVIYVKSDMNKVIVTLRDGSEEVLEGSVLPANYAKDVFERNNSIIKIHVLLKLL